MNDTISRKAAIAVADSTDYTGLSVEAVKKVTDEVVRGLKQLPSTESELARKKDKWINDRGLYKCSCCNQLWTEWWAAAKPIEQMNKDMLFCPMCGADMRGI